MSRTRQRRKQGCVRDRRSSVAGRRSSGRAHAALPVAILALVEPSAREVVLVHDDTRLPREMVWLYLVAPWVAAPMLDTQLLTRPFGEAMRVIASMYVPFLGTPAAVHAAYAWLMPSLLRRARTRSARYTVHAVVCTLTAVAASIVLHPAHAMLCINEMPLAPFVLKSVAFTWTFMFPTLVVQGLRTRAANIERLAHAERQAALEAQLQAIQARTNPHFFFNSLNAVLAVIRDNPARAERMLESIAELFRAVMGDVRKLVPFEQELGLCRQYVDIEQTRLGDRLLVDWQIGAVHPRGRVPQLLLQPIIENAVRYGAERREGDCRIVVRVRQLGFNLEFFVSNPIAREPLQREGNQIGLANIRGRLALIYDLEAKLDAQVRGNRFELTLTIPVEHR